MKKKVFALLRGIAAFLVWAVLMAALFLLFLIFGVNLIPDAESTAIPLWYFFAALFASAFGSALIIRRRRRKRARRRGESTPGEEYEAVSEDLPECSPVSAPVVPDPPAPETMGQSTLPAPFSAPAPIISSPPLPANVKQKRVQPVQYIPEPPHQASPLDFITVIDFETPNQRNDRICSLGLVRIEYGNVVLKYHTLVDPECSFSEENIKIHGIRPGNVAGEAAFPIVWAVLKKYWRNSVVVAHNASFDLNVLNKVLFAYGLPWPETRYMDTMYLCRRYYSDSSSVKLPDMCARLGIPLDHHNAGSDADACAAILLDLLNKGLDESHIQVFTPRLIDNAASVSAAPADSVLSSVPFSQAFVDFRGKRVVLSGLFQAGDKLDISALLIAQGAIVQDNVTRKTDALIVGAYGNARWKHADRGLKIEKAIELQNSGHPIQIFREADVFKTSPVAEGDDL